MKSRSTTGIGSDAMSVGIAIVAAYCDVSQSLYESLDNPAYASARRAQVAKSRQMKERA